MPLSAEMGRALALNGRAQRSGDPEAIIDAQRKLAEVKLAEAIQKIVSTAPPLGVEQRERLAALLRARPTPKTQNRR